MSTRTSAPSRPAGTPAGAVGERRRHVALVLGVAALAAVTAYVVLLIDGSLAAAAPGLPDAGPLVRGGIPAVRAVYDVAAALTIGLLFLATFVLAPERGASDAQVLGGSRLRAVRLAAIAATAWLASGAALLVLTYADVAGIRVGSNGFFSQLNFYIREIELGRTSFISLLLVMLVATCAGGVTRVFPTAWVAAFSVIALFPVALTGHSAGSDDHQNAVDSLFVHLVASSVWVGGLIALLLLAPRLGRTAALMTRRYSTVALWCFVAVAASGVAGAWLRIGGLDGLDTTYGLLVIVKTLLLVVLGVTGWWQRRKVLAGLDAATAAGASTRALFVRLATIEAFVMAFTIGIAVALSRTATPVPEEAPNPIEALLGYPMPVEQTLSLLLTSWYPSFLLLTVAGLLGGTYLYGVLLMRRRGDAWSLFRTLSWVAGCLLLVFVTSGGPAVYGRVSFSAHMLQHMSLMMMVPILLVLGAPITLALRTLKSRADSSDGPREWLLAIVHSRFMRVVANPIVIAVLFVGSLVAFYFSGLFQLSMETHTGHLLMTAHFLLVGYMFVWVMIGIDPGPPRPPYAMRVLLLLVTVSFHAFFGLAIMNSTTVLAPDWWALLQLTDQADLLSDQREGGGIAWAIGELPTLVLVIVLCFQWARDDDREARRRDRQADRDGDAELNAYNEHLAKIARNDERSQQD
jgi:cytochrome c oxidase assembly factor CtaG